MMGCTPSCEDGIMASLNSYEHANPDEIDMSHFSLQHVLGSGGFGIVQQVIKLTGPDRNKLYALKSMSKVSILKRRTGVSSVMTELKILSMLYSCPFICKSHYAFQDPSYVYLVLDLARGKQR